MRKEAEATLVFEPSVRVAQRSFAPVVVMIGCWQAFSEGKCEVNVDDWEAVNSRPVARSTKVDRAGRDMRWHVAIA
ncbi:hypothetical protein GCM10028812_52520 [Ancylobacter sonchi]